MCLGKPAPLPTPAAAPSTGVTSATNLPLLPPPPVSNNATVVGSPDPTQDPTNPNNLLALNRAGRGSLRIPLLSNPSGA